MVCRRIVMALACVVFVAGCADQDGNRNKEKRSRPFTNQHHENCPGHDILGQHGVNFYGPNDTFVSSSAFEGTEPYDGTTLLWMCYFNANSAERAMCSAIEHFRDALSFDSTVPITAESRLENIRNSLYYLREAVLYVYTGLSDQNGCVAAFRDNNESYHRYMAAIAAEAAEMTDTVAREGAEMAVGVSDGLKSSFGTYEEAARHVWGERSIVGDMVQDGMRALAYSMYHGRPWKDLYDINNGPEVRATLPTCTVNGADVAVARSIDLLKRYGVPVAEVSHFAGQGFPVEKDWEAWSTTANPDFGLRCLREAVNEKRQETGLPPLSTAALKDHYNVTDDSLRLAAKALLDETKVTLYALETEVKFGNCTFMNGFGKAWYGIQELVAKASTGLFRLTPAGTTLIGSLGSLQTIYAELQTMAECLLGTGENSDCSLYGALSVINLAAGGDARQQFTNSYQSTRTTLGERYVDFLQIYEPDYDPNDPFSNPRVEVKLVGFSSDQLSSAVLYGTTEDRNMFKGVSNSYYRVLNCIHDQNCDESYYEECSFSPTSNECTVYLPTWQEGPGGTRENIRRKVFILTVDGQPIDMYVERRPSDATLRTNLHTRHHIDVGFVGSRAARVIARVPNNCSQPAYNGLGLPNDMSVPLENELTSDSDTYEDAFAFYLNRATEAAEQAQSAVDKAIQDERNLGLAEVQIDNAKQDALDRIEQICGAGVTSCSVDKEDVVVATLGLLPASGAGDCSGVGRPDVSDLFSKPNKYWDELEAYVRCSADSLIEAVGEMKIQGLPVPILNASRNGTLQTLDFSEFGGEYKVKLLDIKANLVDFRSGATSAKGALDTLWLEIKAQRLEFQAMQADMAANVLQGIGDIFSGAALGGKAGPIGGIFHAAAAAARAAAAELRAFAGQYKFLATMIEKIYGIEQAMLSVEKAVVAIQQNVEGLKLLELEQEQSGNKAERQNKEVLARYVGTDTQQMLKEFRKATLRSTVRARRAVRRAKKMAFIARRALEMKMAVELADEKEPGIIGDPPAEWVDTIYTMYLATEVNDPDFDPQAAVLLYIQKLQDYVYNYPFQYPFADGEDQAVLSLRDDLSSFDEECFEIACTKNLIAWSEVFAYWYPMADPSDCGDVEVTEDATSAPNGTDNQTADLLVFEGQSQCGLSLSSNPQEGTDCEGIYHDTYTASVYLKCSGECEKAKTRQVAISLVAEYRSIQDFTQIIETKSRTMTYFLAFTPGPDPQPVWERYSAMLDGLREPTQNELMTLRLLIGPESLNEVEFELYAWGAQIEKWKPATDYQPTPAYQPRLDENDQEICSTAMVDDPWTPEFDPTPVYYLPAQLRTQKLLDSFALKCVADDFALIGQVPEDCTGKGGLEYLERQFALTLEAIEDGSIVQQGQIGTGNYNYRIASLAVNLVGTNVKDCSLDPAAGTSCYSNLFIPYDLIQDGVVKIRNHSDVDLPFTLSVGRIHQGKGIAAERVLTNPLSSTDQSIVQQYLKREFRGRPIQGNYTLRIYAVPSLRWSNVEDIQILLNYRYWSAFSNP